MGASHCQKALKFFSLRDHPLEYLRVQLEEIQLCEFEYQQSTDSPSRLKISHQALRLAGQCDECLAAIDQRRVQGDPDDYNESFPQEIARLLNFIQTFLKERLKIFKSSSKSTFDDEKQLYSQILRVNPSSPSLPGDLRDALTKMKNIFD